MISSPGFIPSDFIAISKASVPLPTAMPYLLLCFFIKFFSNFISSFPKKMKPFFNELSTFLKMCFLYLLYSFL